MQSAIELFEIIFENFQKKGQLGEVKWITKFCNCKWIPYLIVLIIPNFQPK